MGQGCSMTPPLPEPQFDILLAASPDDLRAAQALRYRVFVQELGAAGPQVNHTEGLEADE